MAIIAMPTCGIKSIEWTIDEPTQVNRSEITSYRKVTILAAKPRWYASVKLDDSLDEDLALPWRAFLLSTKGAANSFRLRRGLEPQRAGPQPLVSGGGQGGYTLLTKGWGAAGTQLRAGHFVTVQDQLLGLTSDVVVDGTGSALLRFGTYLRYIPPDNAPIEANWPTGLMSMPDGRRGWFEEQETSDLSFSCEEAF